LVCLDDVGYLFFSPRVTRIKAVAPHTRCWLVVAHGSEEFWEALKVVDLEIADERRRVGAAHISGFVGVNKHAFKSRLPGGVLLYLVLEHLDRPI